MGEQRVAPGDTIVMHYKLASQSGAELENTFEDEPIEITLGRNELAQNLEQYLIGISLHERHVFMLDAAQAFGHRDEGLIQHIALTEFPATVRPEPDAMIEFQMPSGVTLAGRVMEIGPSEAVVDFNHPLADCAVLFEVEILAIKSEATPPQGSH